MAVVSSSQFPLLKEKIRLENGTAPERIEGGKQAGSKVESFPKLCPQCDRVHLNSEEYEYEVEFMWIS